MITLYLENHETVTLEYEEKIFDDLMNDIHNAMQFGGIFTSDYGDMYYGQEYIHAINANKIIGYLI